jgi:hypothetical protein
MATEERLVKLYVDLPEGETVGGESVWARPLGGDLFEIQNVPFVADDLHFNDVVRAVAPDPHSRPQVREVVRRSGHRTVRVLFAEHVSPRQQQEILGALDELRAGYERGTRRLVAVDVRPEGDYFGVCAYLGRCARAGLLEYEPTARAPRGS